MKHLLVLVALLVPLPVGGQQDAVPDFEMAQSAVEKGEILPLAEILRLLELDYPGQVVEVELEDDDGLLCLRSRGDYRWRPIDRGGHGGGHGQDPGL